MRRTQTCPKCKHNRILSISVVPDTGEHATEIRHLNIAKILLGKGFFRQDQFDRAGELSAAVCRRCGFSELYASDPGRIPIDGTYVTELVGPEPAGPYR